MRAPRDSSQSLPHRRGCVYGNEFTTRRFICTCQVRGLQGFSAFRSPIGTSRRRDKFHLRVGLATSRGRKPPEGRYADRKRVLRLDALISEGSIA